MGRIGSAAIVAGIVAAASGAAQQPAPSVQQQFEAATALSDKHDYAGALAIWKTLEARTAKNRRSHAIVLIRMSSALLGVDRKDEAVAAIRAGLADLPTTDATLQEDRYSAFMILGAAAESAVDYASAAKAYADAEPIAQTPAETLAAQLGIIGTQTFVDPDAAQAAVARADALVIGKTVDPKVTADLARHKGLLLLNRGDFAGARAQASQAVKLLGGLTEKTDTRDVSARSDTALAAMLAGDGDTARKYMAYTGAGRLPQGMFDPAVQMGVPECGGDAGLKPADMAVVEFSIGDDGAILAARPIYAAGGGKVALEFARAARDWSWTPEQVKTLPKFFRYNARVEMRCSTAFERPSVYDALYDARDAWLAGKGITIADAPAEGGVRTLTAERAALAAAEARGGLAIVPPIDALLRSPVVGREEINALAQRALAALDANGAPAVARLSTDLTLRTAAQADGRRSRDYRRRLADLLADPAYARDPQARGAIKLLLADADRAHPDARTRTWLQEVADDAGLKANDPLKVGALVRIASIAQNDGDAAAARAAFDRTGLAASQCAIIDSPPKRLSVGGTYPEEALKWGFDGWTLTQFDIAADGKVVGERAIMSYPPFIFTKAGEKTIAGARYAKSYRPDGSLGCGASLQRVKFAAWRPSTG